MWLCKHLVWRLSEIVNDTSGDGPFLRIRNVVQVLRAAIRQVMEHVEILDRSLAPLLVPKHQIDPVVQVLADIWALQRLSVLGDENLRVTLGPRWQDDVVDPCTRGLQGTKVIAVDVG
jgi:hypothetical protein